MDIAASKIVGKLTNQRQFCGSRGRRRRLHVLLALLLVGTTVDSVADGSRWHPVGNIEQTAESYLRDKVGLDTPGTRSRTTLQAGSLDERHRLAKCDVPLEPFMRRGARVSARTIVGVRCSGSSPWKVYVPVDVVTLATVTVAKAVLPRGHVLSAADLATDQRDVSRQLAGYFSNPGDLVGQRVKYQVIAGRVITPSMLQANNIIKRGQTVTITVNGAGIGVRMAGTALMDGALNQRIRVENRNSGRVVEGVVRSQEHVEIMVPSAGGFFPAKPKVSPPQADTKLSNNDR